MRLDSCIELDVPDADLPAWVYEIRPTGKTIHLGNTHLRASHGYGVDTTALAEPGQIERYRFDTFNWTARQVQAESRIHLVIGPLNNPAGQKNYSSGGPVIQETVEDARAATVRLHLCPVHPSKLVLPVR
jgi:predicted acyl esterase